MFCACTFDDLIEGIKCASFEFKQNVSTPSSFFAPKVRFLLGAYNEVSGRTQKPIERELEADKSFPIQKPRDFEKLETFLIIKLGDAVTSKDLHSLYVMLESNYMSMCFYM